MAASDRYADWTVVSDPVAASSAPPDEVLPIAVTPSGDSSSSSSAEDPNAEISFGPDNPGPVFNMPLRAVMINQGKGYIPFLIQKCMVFLKPHLSEEGLFRVNGEKTVITRLVEAFDRGENVILAQYTRSPNDVASLMKRFFTELPEPLIPVEMNDQFMAAQTRAEAGDFESMRYACDGLPEYNSALLECLLKFLGEVLAYSSVNKMTVPNLATVFGPTLMKRQVDSTDHAALLRDVKQMNAVVGTLISRVNELFGIHRTASDLTTIYEKIRELGSGAFATVWLVQHRVTGRQFAAKIINKKSLNSEERDKLDIEVDILRRIRHPAVISLKGVVETASEFILIMELAAGGELFDKLVNDGKYNESDAVRILKQLLSALEYLHALKIVHRDLKPENILLKAKDSKEIKIADFGLSKLYNEMSNLRSICGSPGFVAPEILSETPYGPEVDMWSMGVIAYILLSGVPPFYANNMRDLFAQIQKGDYTFPAPYWTNVSATAKDFVRHLLVLDPKKRMTAVGAQQHPFIMNERSVTLDDIHIGAVLNRTKQMQREVSVRAVTELIDGPKSQQKPKPTAPSTSSPATSAPAARPSASAAASSSSPSSSSSSSSTQPAKFTNPHRWHKTQYNHPTWCDYCTKFLWGLRFQGVQCTGCKQNLHKKCSEKSGDNCLGSSPMTI